MLKRLSSFIMFLSLTFVNAQNSNLPNPTYISSDNINNSVVVKPLKTVDYFSVSSSNPIKNDSVKNNKIIFEAVKARVLSNSEAVKNNNDLHTAARSSLACTDPTLMADDCDFDGDGIDNLLDFDNDNDGIYNSVECNVSLLATTFNLFSPPNYYDSSGVIWNLSISGNSGTVVNLLGTNYTIPASGALLISIPSASIPVLTENVVQDNKSLLLTSTQPITIVQELTGYALSDSWVVLPRNLWNTTYRLFSYTYTGNAVNNQYAMIYSDSNNNNVVIRNKAGVIQKSFTLNQGQTYLQAGFALDMTGWTVTGSSNIAVIVGVKCANSGIGACDNIDEMLLPSNRLGLKYYLPNGANNTTYVMADQPNTTVKINGVIVTTLVNAGDVYNFTISSTELKVLETSKPSTVWQLSPNDNDPAWLLVLDKTKSVKDFNFTIPASMTTSNVLSLVVPTSSTSLIRLNGAPVSGWVSYPSDATMAYAEVTGLTAGSSIRVTSTTNNVPIISSYVGIGFYITSSTAPSLGNYDLITGQQVYQNCPDADGDSIPDYFDVDSDNDGCSDANEAYGTTIAQGTDGNMYYGNGNPPPINANGTVVGATYPGTNDRVLKASTANINTQPVNSALLVGGNTSFSVTATAVNTTSFVSGVPNFTIPPATNDSSSLLYQWQESTNNGVSWTNIANGGVYSGATTSILTITGVTSAMIGYDYRATVTNPNFVCANLISNSANLCVTTVPTVASVTQPTCTIPSGTIIFNTLIGVEYSVNNGTTYQTSTTFSGLAPGTYILRVRSIADNSCSTPAASTVTINVIPTAPTVPTVASTIQPTCAVPSGTIVFTTQTGVQYSINNGSTYQSSTTFSGLTPGTYTLRVRSIADNTCSTPSASTITINAPTAPTVPIVASTTQPTCAVPTGTIVFTTQTGVEYSINNGTSYQASPTFAGLAPGTYTLRVRSTTDSTCSTQAASTVTINAIPTAPTVPTVASTTQPTCAVPTGTIVFTTQAGVEYSIDNGTSYQASPTFAGLAPGTYTLRVRKTTDTTCSTQAAATVNINAVSCTNLAIIKTVSNSAPTTGSTIVFTIVATNLGFSNATGVVVNDLLPNGYSYVSSTPSVGSYTSGTGVWSIGNLANGASATLTVNAIVLTTGSYINTATITGSQTDNNLSNNSYSASVLPQLSCDKIFTPVIIKN